MKIYLITRLDDVDYDEYIGAVVIAENKKEVWKIVQKKFNSFSIFKCFPTDIKKVKITYIGEPSKSQKRGIIFSSFKAG